MLSTVDQATGTVIRNNPKTLKIGQFANVQIRLEEPLCLELFSNYRMLARVVLRRQHHTIAAGTIIEMLS